MTEQAEPKEMTEHIYAMLCYLAVRCKEEKNSSNILK